MTPETQGDIINDKSLSDKEKACYIFQDCECCPYAEAYMMVDVWRYRCRED